MSKGKDMENFKEVVKSIIFAAGAPISKKEILEGLPDHISRKNLNDVISELEEEFKDPSGILLLTFKDKVQFSSNPKYGDITAEILTPLKEKELSRVLLEVLAIIAYKQPVTKAEIEEIRGVSSEYAVTTLQKVDLIKVVGQKDTIGRPLLYATTDEFLKKFELHDIDDLPDYEEIMERVNSIYDPTLAGEGLYRQRDIKDVEEKEKTQAEIIEEQMKIRKEREEEVRLRKEQLAEIDERIKLISDVITENEIPDFLDEDEMEIIEVDDDSDEK